MRVRLLREAGGLGDVVRCLGVARAIRRVEPDAEVWFYVLSGYAAVARMAPDVARVIEVPRSLRRGRDEWPDPTRHEYLRRHGVRFDATVDMYCPGFRHERETQGAVTLDRIECWTREAARVTHLDLGPTLPWLPLPERFKGRAEGFLEAHGIEGKGKRKQRLVGVQPISVGVQRSLTEAQVTGIVAALREAGATPLLIHSARDPVGRWAAELGVPAAMRLGWGTLFALVAELDGLVGCDSGLYHVAAAYGVPASAAFACTSGRVIRRHYLRAVAFDAGEAEREGLPCTRACYTFASAGHRAECKRTGCPALARMPAKPLVAGCLAAATRS